LTASQSLWKDKKGGMDEATRKAKHAKLLASMKKLEDPSLVEFMKEMKEINLQVAGTSKGVKINLDENFCKKFGSLKKASVLAYYGRNNEAFEEICKAAEIVKNQKAFDEQRNTAIRKRWCFKLGLDEGFELPFPIDKIHPDDVTNKMLSAADAGVPIATMRLYLDAVSPFKLEEYSKNAYIN
jgi:hypothetical protein